MMRVELLKDARIKHKAGEIVEVSPEEYNFLVSVKAAVPVVEEKPKRGTKRLRYLPCSIPTTPKRPESSSDSSSSISFPVPLCAI